MPTIARRLSLLLALGWMAFIFWESSSAIQLDLPELFPHEDKLAHLVLFGLLAAFWLGSFPTTSTGYRSREVWFAILIATLYGALDEWHQSFVPGRTADPLDLLADGVGALLFAWSLAALMRARLGQSKALRSG